MTHENKVGVLVCFSFVGMLGFLVVSKGREEAAAAPETEKPKSVAAATPPPAKRQEPRAQDVGEKKDLPIKPIPEVIPAKYQTQATLPLPPNKQTISELPSLSPNLQVPEVPLIVPPVTPPALIVPAVTPAVSPVLEVKTQPITEAATPNTHLEPKPDHTLEAAGDTSKPNDKHRLPHAVTVLGIHEMPEHKAGAGEVTATPKGEIPLVTPLRGVPVEPPLPPISAPLPTPPATPLLVDPPLPPSSSTPLLPPPPDKPKVVEPLTTPLPPPGSTPLLPPTPVEPLTTPLPPPGSTPLLPPTPTTPMGVQPLTTPLPPPGSTPLLPPTPTTPTGVQPLNTPLPPPTPLLPPTPEPPPPSTPLLPPTPITPMGVQPLPPSSSAPLIPPTPIRPLSVEPLNTPLSPPGTTPPQNPSGETITRTRATETSTLPPKPELTASAAGFDRPQSPPGLGQPMPNRSGQGGAQVRSFTEKVYTWKTSDNYESVSEKYYYTKGLAGALKAYNKTHPQATDNQRGGGDPTPGERVYLPPVAQLDTGDQASKPLITVPLGAPTPGAPLPTYKVAQENLYIMNVARETLGDVERWRELLKLNSQIDPSVALPVGTILRLPANAVAVQGQGK